MSDLPRMYVELADWFHLLTRPEDYAEEAALYRALFERALGGLPENTLELGCGGGNNASHMKSWTTLTLTDPSAAMLAQSRRINPGCEHVEGDMRTLRLGRQFDAVFVHDAICYMTSEADLARAIETVFIHCRPGGAALLVPDDLAESFAPAIDHGGHDGDDGRALRYLEWHWDPDPTDSETICDYAYLLRSADGNVRSLHDRHVNGLFARATWVALMRAVGFVVERAESDLGNHPFLVRRPG